MGRAAPHGVAAAVRLLPALQGTRLIVLGDMGEDEGDAGMLAWRLSK